MVVAGIILSILLAIVGLFQILLVAGLPLGEFAWGGRQGKVLPKWFRLASFFSVLFFVYSIVVVLTKVSITSVFSDTFVNGYMVFLTVYLGIGIIMNAISRSKKERLWAPYIAVMFVLCLVLIG